MCPAIPDVEKLREDAVLGIQARKYPAFEQCFHHSQNNKKDATVV